MRTNESNLHPNNPANIAAPRDYSDRPVSLCEQLLLLVILALAVLMRWLW
jgi:hypothetical protein